jgi:hypothetical protein
MSTYTSTARRTIEQIQAVVDHHPISSADGRCVVCEVEGPCWPRHDALRALAAWHQLPRRRPGATRPQLIGARRVRV